MTHQQIFTISPVLDSPLKKGGGNEEGEAAERSFYGHTVHLQIPMPVSCWWGGVRSEFENLGTGTGKVIVFLFSLHINT